MLARNSTMTLTLPSHREIVLTRLHRDDHLNSAMETGAAETLDRLAEHLSAMA